MAAAHIIFEVTGLPFVDRKTPEVFVLEGHDILLVIDDYVICGRRMLPKCFAVILDVKAATVCLGLRPHQPKRNRISYLGLRLP